MTPAEEEWAADLIRWARRERTLDGWDLYLTGVLVGLVAGFVLNAVL